MILAQPVVSVCLCHKHPRCYSAAQALPLRCLLHEEPSDDNVLGPYEWWTQTAWNCANFWSSQTEAGNLRWLPNNCVEQVLQLKKPQE